MRIDLLKNIYTMKQPKLGEKISQLRKQKGLTQEELIEKCNINVRTIQRIESGEVTPRSYTLKTILNALDYDLSEIQSEDFQSTFKEKTLDTFKANWFQEAKEKYIGIISVFLIFSFTYVTLNIFNLEEPYLSNLILFILVAGFFSYFTFPFFAGYFERRKKYTLEKQLENKDLIAVNYSLLKLLGILIFYFAVIISSLLNIYFLCNRDLWSYSDLNWSGILTYSLLAMLYCYFAFKTITKVFTRKFGLVLDDNGVTDNSSELSAGFVPWSDVKEIGVRSLFFNKKAIIVIFKDPEEHINKYKPESYKRKVAEASLKRFYSPIQLKTNYLDIRPSQLYHVLNVKLQEYMDKH